MKPKSSQSQPTFLRCDHVTIDDVKVAIIKIWNSMFRGMRGHLDGAGFVEVHGLPEVVGVTGACEDIDTLFMLDYFGHTTFLSQSDQLYLELLTPELGRVYTEVQSFRREASVDDRHLCQFTLFEIELLGGLDELIDQIESTVRAACRAVVSHAGDALLRYGSDPERLSDVSFERITYTEAIEDLSASFPELTWGQDLRPQHEALLADRFGPVFVTHYPAPIKFFNMKESSSDPRTVDSVDLILPFSGEATGGAAREVRYPQLLGRLQESPMYAHLLERGISAADFDWYLDRHRDADIPEHAGAGIGVGRLAQFVLGAEDIREAVPFLVNREVVP